MSGLCLKHLNVCSNETPPLPWQGDVIPRFASLALRPLHSTVFNSYSPRRMESVRNARKIASTRPVPRKGYNLFPSGRVARYSFCELQREKWPTEKVANEKGVKIRVTATQPRTGSVSHIISAILPTNPSGLEKTTDERTYVQTMAYSQYV